MLCHSWLFHSSFSLCRVYGFIIVVTDLAVIGVFTGTEYAAAQLFGFMGPAVQYGAAGYQVVLPAQVGAVAVFPAIVFAACQVAVLGS
jgi:hypothetical protein